MTSENCPQCEKKLAPPFKSSGRQVCSGCGWTNQLKSTVKSETTAKPKSKQSISLPALKFSKRILIISGSSLAILILGIGGLASWSETRVACSTKSGEPAYKALKN
ncbi:MAG: hypothetical protein RLZZ171_350, partial [Cyanobacteriota bacterium]